MRFRAAGALVLFGCSVAGEVTPAAEPPPIWPDAARPAPETPLPGPAEPPGAADPPGATEPTETPGSRLRRVWLTAEDGTRQAVHAVWFDSALETECSFTLAGDGTTRCLPTAGASTVGFFSNSACTPESKLFARIGGACTQGDATIGAEVGTACPNTTRLFRIAPYTGAIWSVGGDGTCTSADPLVSFAYYARTGGELAPTEFVAATREVGQ